MVLGFRVSGFRLLGCEGFGALGFLGFQASILGYGFHSEGHSLTSWFLVENMGK